MKKTAEERIGEFNRFGSILGLDRMRELLECLGHPEKDLKIIHVAGTNGKGSTCKYTYESLRFNNYKVGLYSSPYIELFNERISFDGQDISEEDLERLTDIVIGKCDEIVAAGHDSPTEFEVVTAIALMYFKEKGADYVILEVGLGGRGDSTNVIEKPLISVITSIDFDHMDRLGNTLPEIAFEKAGIIKKDVPVISNVCDESARHVIESRAAEQGANFMDISGISAEELGIGHDAGAKYQISMAGKHQLQNAKTAVSVLNNLQQRGLASLDSKLTAEGMRYAKQPGRFEIISEKPLVILDGAHNRGGAQALQQAVDEYASGRRVQMVVAILKDKDVPGMTEIFRRIGTDFIVTEIDDPRSSKAEDLAEYFKNGSVTDVEKDAKEAVRKALDKASEYDMTIIAGSLYLIGEVRSTAIEFAGA